jgi:Zn-finger nucleic acid-binding protein
VPTRERRNIKMDCPRCKIELKPEDYQGIEVDRCPQCQGMWLDYGELDQLEDKVFDKDELKGTLVYGAFKSDLHCPKCGKIMTGFRYRANNLELDLCEEGHGTWLDGGEEKRVLELMAQRIKDLDRKGKAEAEWGDFLHKLRSRSFASKVKDLFKK